MTRSAFVLLCSFAACAGTPPPAKPAVQPTFELGEITVFDGANAMLKIHADGTTELGGHAGRLEIKPGETASTDSLPIVWKPGPTLKPDGSIELRGQAVVRVNRDGSVQDLKRGTTAPLTIDADKVSFTTDGRTVGLALAADGSIELIGGLAKADKPPRVEGADTPGKRRAVLALMGLMLHGGRGETKVEGPTEAP